MEPILTYSEITGHVYIVTKYRRLGGGVIDAREKFDVTDWVESYAKKRNAQTVEENTKLRDENERLRTVAVRYYTELLHSDDVLGQIMARKKLQELGVEVDV